MSQHPTLRALHPSGRTCRICGGELLEAFQGVLLGDISVTYGICGQCGSLILPDPYWLDRAYSTVFEPDPDTGVGLRTSFVARIVRVLQASGRLASGDKALDFGTGKGVLLDQLVQVGLDAWGFDPYPNPELAKDRVVSTLPERRFQLITCIEVLEHTTDPIATLESLQARLETGGTLLLSTEFFDAAQHGRDWWYLVPEHGQHITIFSQEGFRRATERVGLVWHQTLTLQGRPFLHILSKQKEDMGEKIRAKFANAAWWWGVKGLLRRWLAIGLAGIQNPKVVWRKVLKKINHRPRRSSAGM